MRLSLRKYRVILPVLNGTLAIVLLFMGQNELWNASHFRPPHSNAIDPRFSIPPAQRASYCLNFPAFVISGPIRLPTATTYIFQSERWFMQVSDAVYIIVVFGFWWWLGRTIDRPHNLETRRNSAPILALYILLVLAAISVLAICIVETIKNELNVGRVLPICGIVWSLILLALFAGRLKSRWRAAANL